MDVPFVKKPVHYYSDRSQAPEWLRDAEKKLEQCDGFIYLCPEVNRSIPPNLANFIDHFGSNIYQAKPAAIITYSDNGMFIPLCKFLNESTFLKLYFHFFEIY